jgi:pimeloyl-ACP methyl ester carboxylesterase
MANTALKTKEYSPPSALLALTELPRAMFELGSLPWATPMLMRSPRGDGHPVLVLPGFMTSDVSTSALRGFLAKLGYQTFGWELGRNLGPKAIGADGERLMARLEEIYAQTGQKVSLVGWSLGGLMARLIAWRRPELVRQVITLGSPIGGSPKATNAWRAYQFMSGQDVNDEKAQEQIREGQAPAPVPSTAIYSKNDGIVAWQICREPDHDLSDNIEVEGSHCGLGVNPVVLYAVADRLAQADGKWKRFDRKGLRAFFYKDATAH